MPVAKLRKNPVGPAFDTMEDDDNIRFEVTHNGVGVNMKGDVVGARAFGPGADLERLVKLGAIRRLSIEETEKYWEEHPRPAPEDEDESDGGAPPPLKAAKAPRRRTATRPIATSDPRDGAVDGGVIPALNGIDKEVQDPADEAE